MKIACPQCGADTQLQDPAGFVRCAFCGSSLVLDLGGIRPHLLCVPRHTPNDVLPLIRSWCDQRGVPVPSGLRPPQLVYRPFWRFPAGPLVAAWPTIEPRWSAVQVPQGAQRVFDPEAVRLGHVVEPTVAEAAMRQGEAAGDLLHLPFYDVQGSLGSHAFQLSVDACSGQVYPEPVLSARSNDGQGAFIATAALGFVLMFIEAVAIPHAGLAGVAVVATAAFVYWAMRGVRTEERGWA